MIRMKDNTCVYRIYICIYIHTYIYIYIFIVTRKGRNVAGVKERQRRMTLNKTDKKLIDPRCDYQFRASLSTSVRG